jgi:hypothetical protein
MLKESRGYRLVLAVLLIGLVAPAGTAPVEIVVRDKKAASPCRAGFI